jgi:uncharacterized protein
VRKLKVEYHYSFNLPRKLVWKWIKDVKVIRNSIASCKSFDETEKGIFQGLFDIQFGLIQDVFSLEIRRIQEKKPSFYHFHYKGKSKLGEIQGEINLFLVEKERACDVNLKATAQLTSSLPIAEQYMTDGALNPYIEKFFKRLDKEMRKAILDSRRKNRK